MVLSTQFEHPYVLLLISPLILAGLYYIRRGVSKWIIISRIIILSLLIMALASPYSLGISTLRDDAPKITVISDNTMSMDLFNKDLGKKVYDALQPKTPTKFREFAGIKSPIGDEVIGASENNNLVLVTDGNANYGKDLFDAISFVSQTGTRVFAVEQKPLHNDASVEIESSKNIIIGNENVFNVIVRQAGTDISYRLDVEIDGKPVFSESFTQNIRKKPISINGTFTTLGSHKIKAMITPATEDRFKLNNVFYKSIFVVPKPNVLAVTSDPNAPLYDIKKLYEVTIQNSIQDDLSKYKAVIIDNAGSDQLRKDITILRTYVGNGGGLIVVGGDASYDKGKYNNSSIESLLPIISRGSESKGGRNVVIIIDSSGSTKGEIHGGRPITKEEIRSEQAFKILCPSSSASYEEIKNENPESIICYEYEDSYIGLIDANAISVVRYIDRGSSVGVVAFGGKTQEQPIMPMSSEQNRKILEDFITSIGPESGDNPTDIQFALNEAGNMLKSAGGSKLVILLSDGEIHNEDIIVNAAQSLRNQGIEAVVGQIQPSNVNPNPKYEELAKVLGTNVIVYDPSHKVCELGDCLSGEKGPEATPTPAPTPDGKQFMLGPVDTEHFITKYVNISASVSGYNDVTPKLGSDWLLAAQTSAGNKPILTTWGFGLGRVAAFTTDNGNPSSDPTSPWASAVYSGENSRLISSMINWAIGDPRPKEGDVINAEDIWAGTAGKIIVTSDKQPPHVELDGAPLELSRTGPTTYETSISLDNPDTENFHDISGYGIAVNYPLEYREIGFNEKLKAVIESNGGRVYNEDEVEGLLFVDIKEKAVRTVNEPKSEKEPYLLAALVLFLTEVIIRRLKDYRKERPLIEENQPRTAQVAE